MFDGNLGQHHVQGIRLNVGSELDDMVHCVVFVIPCDAVTDAEYMKKLSEIQEYARGRGKPLPDICSTLSN
jgi:hypothetical protein